MCMDVIELAKEKGIIRYESDENEELYYGPDRGVYYKKIVDVLLASNGIECVAVILQRGRHYGGWSICGR